MFRWLFALLLLAAPAGANTITLASTRSLENSGLLAQILPKFTRSTGIVVSVLPLATSQALAAARRGDANLLLLNDIDAESAFIANGHGFNRREIAWNDFLLVGPASDPAGLRGMQSATAALYTIASKGVLFISRGDGSGTDAMEKRLWQTSGVAPAGLWYRDIHGGMGAALTMAAAVNGVTLTDRGSWNSFRHRQTLVELVAGDPMLINRYSIIEIQPGRHSDLKAKHARALAEWLVSPSGQAAIGAYRIGGEPLFHPSLK